MSTSGTVAPRAGEATPAIGVTVAGVPTESAAPTVDVHQHLLGEPLVEALARRTEAPMLIRHREGWIFRVPAEPDSVLAFGATDVAGRAAALDEDGVDRALVALSTALGVESLPGEEALELIEAHHQGLDDLPTEFGGWGAVQLESPDPFEVDAALDRGRVGITLPAPALADLDSLAAVGPLLARLEARDAPLFVHPGPVGWPATGRPAPVAGATPPPVWWPALTDYVAQMQAAWFAFLHAGRAAHPRLRVLFAMLAGGAPLQLERYAARSGSPVPAPDPLVFYDTSSYGPRMLSAMTEAVGPAQLVFGSDRPVVDPAPAWPDPDLRVALLATNPARLLNQQPKGALA
jgi:predicted TIM-barrel fold metal-dependent hydrolase